eukprot:TRINITY_DN6656_c1_g1_i1.p1 TRINITY_DN6656_c1_g1~~TRINITY_DN6656_c1_g1_i1.p1  ORF type:complete len:674 (-),score=102.16 TRINITY_DN6656_c1_g1_i1:83-1954(-)
MADLSNGTVHNGVVGGFGQMKNGNSNGIPASGVTSNNGLGGMMSNGGMGINELLAEQLTAMHRALTLSQALANRIGAETGFGNFEIGSQCSSPTRSPTNKNRQLRSMLETTLETSSLSQEGRGGLAEPLLGQSAPMPSGALSQSASGASLTKADRQKNGILPRNIANIASLRYQALDIGSRCRGAAQRLATGRGGRTPRTHSLMMPPKEEKPEDKRPPGEMHKIFEDADAVKKEMQVHLERNDDYNVEDLYKKEGIFQYLARSAFVKNLTLAMIILSTLWIAIDTDYNKATILCNAGLMFQVVDNFICLYFFGELLIRFFAFEQRSKAFTDKAFMFDLFLVVLMVWETWIQVILYLFMGSSGNINLSSALRSFRIFRTLRALRLSRLFRSVPELMILINGMAMAIRSVCTTLVLLVLITYTFGIIFTQLLSGSPLFEGTFDTVPQSTNFLLLQVLCGFDITFILKILNVSCFYYAILLTYLLLGSLTIMNMLIGVLVEVVGTAAEMEHDERELKSLKQDIADIVAYINKDGDTTVTEEEFKMMIHTPEAVHKLYEGGVNVLALVDFADFIFRDVDELTLEDFVSIVLQFRGSNQASVKDVVDLRVYMSKELARIHSAAAMMPV